MEEPIYKEQKKYNEIVVNKEIPKLNNAQFQNKNDGLPDPEKDEKEFKKQKLKRELEKKKRRMNKGLLNQVNNPELFKPKAKSMVEPSGDASADQKDILSKSFDQTLKKEPLYKTEKKENLKENSIATKELSRMNIENGKKIARENLSDNDRMKLIRDELKAYAEKKQEIMLKGVLDMKERQYIIDCIYLDMLMKLQNASRENIKNEKARNSSVKTIQGLIDAAEKRLKDNLAVVEEHKQQKNVKQNTPEKKTGKKTETKKEPKKETKKEELNPLYKVEIKKDVKKKKEPEKKTTNKPKTEIRYNTGNKINNQINNQIVNQNNGEIEIKGQEQLVFEGPAQLFYYKKQNGPNKYQMYTFVRREPANLKEALELRAQVTKHFDVTSENCLPALHQLYTYFDHYVEQFGQNEQIPFPPEYMEKIDITSYCAEGKGLEVAALLRNRITEGGLLYKDLKGGAKEAYDYYDRIVKRLMETDGTLSENVVQHEKRQTQNYNITLNSNLNTEYEMQAPSSNDCWSCAGSAILNHYLQGPNYKKVTQEAFRAFKPTLLTKEEMGVDQDTFDTQKQEINVFTIQNQKKDRRRSPMGNPYMVADFYLQELKKAGKQNTAVRKMVFQPGRATRQKNGVVDSKGKSLGKDTNALHNLREKFKKTVYEALKGNSAITLLKGMHYLTIVGIDGDTLKVHNSANADNKPGTIETRSINSIISEDATARGVELVWFQSITDPAQITNQFKNISYDQNTKQFGQNVKNYSENIGQKEGIGAWKTLDEKDEDIADLVMEGIYLPKQLQ